VKVLEVLTQLVKNVAAIVLLTTFLDMILPSSRMQRFIKVVMGLFVMVALLNPLLNLLQNGPEFEAFHWQLVKSPEKNNLLSGNKLEEVNQEMFLEDYKRRIQGQMKALISLAPGVEDVEVEVDLIGGRKVGALEGIEQVRVVVYSGAKTEKEDLVLVEPVVIEKGDDRKEGIHPGLQEDKKVAETVKNTLCQYYGIKPQQVRVIVR
jgi:stage III sporulation protein AF